MMAASAESQPPRDRPRLSNLSREIQQGFFEVGQMHCDTPPSMPFMPLTRAVSVSSIENSLEVCASFRMQLCVQNSGRPAAAALSQVVTAALQAFQAGYALDRLRLEMEHGTHTAIDAAGYRLMESERRYRTQWLDTVRLAPRCSKKYVERNYRSLRHGAVLAKFCLCTSAAVDISQNEA